jgi:peptidoglycan hydrolase-like protein with peptidoglycan-binding domain
MAKRKNTVRSRSARSKPSSRPQAKARKGQPSIVLTALAVGAAGILGYLGWQYVRKRKMAKSADLDAMLNNQSASASLLPASSFPTSTIATSTATPSYVDTGLVNKTITSSILPRTDTRITSRSTTGSYPLKKGSKGEMVRALQRALMDKYGAGILPRYGADGDFGSETVNALKKVGLPTSIDESTYNVLVQGGNSVTDATALASKLYAAAINRNLNAVMALLKQLKNKEDYRQVSSVFSGYRLRGVRQTLVNGLLGTFRSEDQKQKIRFEFLRMGLRYDGNRWSLDGLDGRPIITVEPTAIWLNATESVQVPASMVLGPEVTRRLDYTLFENNKKYFLVPTKSVQYL